MSDTPRTAAGLATESPVRLRGTVFDARTRELGATSETERARLAGITRNTLYRWRKGCATAPRRARRAALRLNLSVDDLFDFDSDDAQAA